MVREEQTCAVPLHWQLANLSRVDSSGMQELPPLYPVDIWNAHKTTLLDRSSTSNLCESWNNGLFQIVVHYHPSVWTLIDALRQDSAVAETEIAESSRSTTKVTCQALPGLRDLPKRSYIKCGLLIYPVSFCP